MAKRKTALSDKVCKTKGCGKAVPLVALRHGDPYCSAICLQVDLGLKDPEQAKKEKRQSKIAREGADAGWREGASMSYALAEKSGKAKRRGT